MFPSFRELYQQISYCGIALLAASIFPSSAIRAEDWPHWMGPNRNNVWETPVPPTRFPKEGLKEAWKVPVGIGYAGPSVYGDRVYITDFVSDANVQVSNFDRRPFEGKERVLALDAGTGSVLWQKEYNVRYTVSYPSGPRCTPIVDGDRLYTLGAEGDLYCFDRATGNPIWTKKLKDDYLTESALWGYAAHPLIDGDKLITLAGGPGSVVVCLDKMTGNEIWKHGTANEIGYVPPSIIEAGGKRQLLIATGEWVCGLDPQTGKEYWSVPYQASYGSIIMTPIYSAPYLYIGGYSKKNLLLELGQNSPTAQVVWRDLAKKAVSPVNVQPLLVDETIYGFDESGELIAFDLKTGKRYWETSKPVSERPIGNGTAFIVRSADLFYLFNDAGELVIAKLSPESYRELDRTKIIRPTNNANGREVVWSAPAFANGAIYARNDQEIVCVPLVSDR